MRRDKSDSESTDDGRYEDRELHKANEPVNEARPSSESEGEDGEVKAAVNTPKRRNNVSFNIGLLRRHREEEDMARDAKPKPGTAEKSTQWQPSGFMNCTNEQGVVQRIKLQPEYPGQTAVPWVGLRHIQFREKWDAPEMAEPKKVLDKATPELQPLFAGPMLNIMSGHYLGRRSLYVVGRHKRLIRSEVQIWSVGQERAIQGYLTDSHSACPEQFEGCETVVHLHSRQAPYQRGGTLHFRAAHLMQVEHHDILVIKGYCLRAILAKCF